VARTATKQKRAPARASRGILRNGGNRRDGGVREDGGIAAMQMLVSIPHCTHYDPLPPRQDPRDSVDTCFWLDCHQGEFTVTITDASGNVLQPPVVVKPGQPKLFKGKYRKLDVHGSGEPKDGGTPSNNAGHITPC
jgi:hypothetical protein